jgi:DNA-binding response OmpR family regulator
MSSPPALAPGGRPHILVVDDEDDLLATYERLLARQGYRVVPVASREGGLYMIETARPDLVITDLRLADGDGLDIARAAQALPPPRPPVIIVTALTSAPARQASMAAGASAFVAKPFSAVELSSLVRRLVGGIPF